MIDVFVDDLKLFDLGFERVSPKRTGRPSYHPAVLLKLYVYGYLNCVQSSRRLEPSLARTTKKARLADKIATLKEEMKRLEKLE